MKTTTRYFAGIAILLMAIYGTAFAQDETPPSTPDGLQVIETHNTAIGISWNASTDNVGVAEYYIYKDGNYEGRSVDNEYILLDLSINTSYIIEVSAFDASSNESAKSSSINPTTSTSSITGTVYSTEGPVAGALVSLAGFEVNTSTIANEDGEYRFDNLLPRIYEVSVGSITYIEYVTEGHTIIQDFMPDDGRPIVHTSPKDGTISINTLGGGHTNSSGILDKGVVWSTNPYISDLSGNVLLFGPGAGSFVGPLNGLVPNTVYYIKAFAENSQGIGWGEEYQFYTGCPTIILNEEITNTSCGGTDGAITISHLLLEGPFTYNWTGPDGFSSTSQNISGLSTGTYELTVMERDGCEIVKSYEITEPPPPSINNISRTICADISFNITPVDETNGVVPPGTTYSWAIPVVTGELTGGAAATGQTSINGTLSNPTNTEQTAIYTVTPSSGTCTGATFEVTVIVYPSPEINNLNLTTCGGSEFNVTPENGSDGIVPPGTTYSWGIPVVTGGLTGGAAAAGQISISGTLSNPTSTVQTATYIVTPTTGPCTGATFTVTVAVNPTPVITANLTHISCYGCTDGAIDISPSGGIPPYTYSWTGPGVFTSTDQDISNLVPGLYTVNVAGQNLCTGDLQVEIVNPLVVSKTSDYNPYGGGDVAGEAPIPGTLRYAMEYANDHPGPDSISFNIEGNGPFTIYPTSNLPEIVESLIIDGYSQPGTSPANENTRAIIHIEINGSLNNNPLHTGFIMESGGSIIRGLMINNFYTQAVYISQNSFGNRIEGNYIGLAADGESVVENERGVVVQGPGNFIGGSEPGTGNVISGNNWVGVQINGRDASGNFIQGNIIGLDATGSSVIEGGIGSSDPLGIELNECLNTTVGGINKGEKNIIAGNFEGIFIYAGSAVASQISNNRIIGNYIGTNPAGSETIGNLGSGISIAYEGGITIGGKLPGECNIISGNWGAGIMIRDSPQTSILGNFIGTDPSGTTAIPNQFHGINTDESQGFRIGGPEVGEGNLISGNIGDGINISPVFGRTCVGIIIQGNYIGTDISGAKPLGNMLNENSPITFGNGITLHLEVTDTQIGGVHANEGNLIAFNENCGIEVYNIPKSQGQVSPYGYGNSIFSNSIHSNGSLGINLYDEVDDAVTANDPLDADDGPNGLQNYPVLDTVYFSQDEINIFGFLNSVPDEDFLLQFFVSPEADEIGYGEGKTFIGSETVHTNPSTGFTHFNFSFPSSLRNGLVVTATATDEAGNTSEFSNAAGGGQNQEADMPMYFVIHEEGIPYITDGSDFQALQSAFDTWTAIPSSAVVIEYVGTTDLAKAVANDGINLITFMDETYFTTNEVLGLAAKTLFMNEVSGTAEIVDADIVFNPYFTQGDAGFSTDTHTGMYDLQSIATHELGHTFGMIHSGVLESTMFFAIMDHSTDSRTLEQDDIAWASYRYPEQDVYNQVFGSISGNILYGDDPLFPPVGGAIVIASNTSTGDAIHAYSDENGDYLIPVPAGTYTVAIEPLDGNVHGYYLTKANISYYIDAITVYTDFPKEYYNFPNEGWELDDPNASVAVSVTAGSSTSEINLITNKDQTPPEVVAVTPKRDSTGVSVMTQVFMGFSEQVDINTFTDETCSLIWEDGEATGDVLGNFVVADNYGRRIAFTPREYPLDYSRLYTLQITSGVTDLKGNGLIVPEVPFIFTTEEPDEEAPVVTDMIPDHGIDTVFTNANIMVFFSEAMDVSTTPDGFSLVDDNEVTIHGEYSWDEDLRILTFNPGTFLAEGTEYTVSVTPGLADLSGNPLVKDSLLVFSTIPEANPKIIYVGPGPDQESVSLDSPLVIDFTEPIDPQTVNTNSIRLLLNGSQVAGSFKFLFDNSRVIFRPDQLLSPNTPYNVIVPHYDEDDMTTPVFDVSDTPLPLQVGVSYQFTTADNVIVPFIDHLQPSSGIAGTLVTIGGSGIDPNPDLVTVMFGDKEATVLYSESTYLTTRVPSGATEGMVTIQVGDDISNEEYFYVVPINEYPGDEIRRVVGTQSQAEDVEIEPDAAYAYITNSGADAITRLNMVTFQVMSLDVGQMPVQIDIHPNGDMAYVSNHLSHDVSVIDLDKMEVVQTIAVGINPYGLVVSPNGDLLLVANTTSEDVLFIDVDPNSGGYDKVVRSVKTSASNTDIDMSPDAGLALIACDQGILFLITDPDDPAVNTIVRTVKTSASASSVEILPDAGLAVAATDDNYLVVFGIIPGTNYAHIVGQVNTRSSIGDIEISPDGQIIYVSHPLTDEVDVYQINYTGAPNADASVNVSIELELINVIEVDEAPYAIAVDPRQEKVLVGHYTYDGQVTEIYITGTVDVISDLEDLIESVRDAIGDGFINRKYAGKLLVDLDKTLSRYNSGQLESAIDHLDNFIERVKRWMSYGEIPEDPGYDWLDAAYRIRAQLLADLLAQENLKKGTAANGSDSGNSSADHTINNKDLIGTQVLKIQNQPNPFSMQTRINFEIPEIGRADIPVVMRVFNTNGQVVRTLVHMDMEPGRYSVSWSGSLDDGGLVPDGIYLLELSIPGQRDVLTISIIR